jgi:A/G-specific adenine glycosylase
MLALESKIKFQRRLLKWFDENQRDLPWRKNKTPYRIWISEIMLQQTQVATVIDYYTRFMKQFPSVKKLAAANEAQVLKLWEGLGYYRRARQLHAAAKIVADKHAGRFPTTFNEVLALPGIGRYTAGAILSISQDQPLPILEGNTIRLFARLMQMKVDPKLSASQKALWEFSENLLPKKRCGDFNQALMEVGNQICSPKNPRCLICPIHELCPTAIKGLQLQIPVASKKMKYEDLHEAVILVQRKNKFLIRQCGPGERWENLWDFPRLEIATAADPAKPKRGQPQSAKTKLEITNSLSQSLHELTGLQADLIQTDIRLKHAVTRFRITLDCYRTENLTGRIKNMKTAIRWATLEEISDIPMSTTGRKIANKL